MSETAAVPSGFHRPGTGAILAGYVALYVFLDWVSYWHPLAPFAITPWNPPPGLSLALLLLAGVRWAPALFLAALAAEVLVRGFPLSTGILLLACSLPAIGYSFAAMALLRVIGGPPRFDSLRHLSLFIGVAALAAFAVALAYVGVVYSAGAGRIPDFWQAVLRFWVGDLIGIVVTTPAVMLIASRIAAGSRLVPRFSREIAFQVAAVAAALWLIFGVEATDEFKFFYLMFLPLAWIAMRHGVEGAVCGAVGIQVALIVAVELRGHVAVTALEFQMLMFALAATGLVLGAAVSERRAAQARLAERQLELDRTLRLAAAGEMASALAHELNQPLSALATYLRACQIMLADVDAHRDELLRAMDKVVAEAARAGDVVHRLRDFFRSGMTQFEPVLLEVLIAEVEQRFASRLERHRIALEVVIEPDLPAISLDKVQMTTVLGNLLGNAIEALAFVDGGGRRVSVNCRRSGAEIEIRVADNGPGIDVDAAARMFEPFMTSKASGIGMGLALSRSIVEAHGGRLRFEPAERGGACFCLVLPLDPADVP